MPRNITLTFDDGTTHVYKNAPDDATPKSVYDRAAKEFSSKKIKNIDGGRQPTAEQPERTVMGYLGETVGNIPGSAAEMGIGMYEAITSPIQTAKGLGLAAYGGARNVAEATLPTSAFEAIKSVENPEVAKQAVDVANAIGGIYKDRYGSVNQLLDTIRTDPVGAAADLSIIFSGGAAAATKLPTISKALGTVGRAMDPIGALAGKVVETGGRLAAKGVNRLATSAQTRVLNEMAAGQGPALVQAARATPRYPGVTPTFAEATVDVPAPRVQAVGVQARDIQPEAEIVRSRAQQKKMLSDLETISGTPAQREAANNARDAQAKADYGKAFAQTVVDDDTLRGLFKRPAMQRAVDVATKVAAERNEQFSLGTSKPQRVFTDPFTGAKTVFPATNAKFNVENLHRVKIALDDIAAKPQDYGIAGEEARAIRDTRAEFIGWLEGNVPEYETARKNYAQASKALARQEWGAYAIEKLTSAMSPDAPLRERNFANAVRESLSDQKGPAALRRVIGGGARYADLSKLLTPTELGKVNDIVSQLGREEQAAMMAQLGSKAAPDLGSIPEPAKKLNLLNRALTVGQYVYDAVTRRLGEEKGREIALAMLNADTMVDLMEKAVKSQQRVEKVTKPIRAASTAARRVIQSPVGTVGARLQTEENRNAFLTDAQGRSYDVQGNRLR
jgi:hypothetical protein